MIELIRDHVRESVAIEYGGTCILKVKSLEKVNQWPNVSTVKQRRYTGLTQNTAGYYLIRMVNVINARRTHGI